MADHNLKCQEFWKQESIDVIIVKKSSTKQLMLHMSKNLMMTTLAMVPKPSSRSSHTFVPNGAS
jgi:hypothetical protein